MRYLNAELLKLKNTRLLWFVLLCALVTPVIIIATYSSNNQTVIELQNGAIWSDMFNIEQVGVASFVLPVMTMLLCAFIFNIEHSANSWKHLLILPGSKIAMLTSKLIVVMLLIFVFFLFSGIIFFGEYYIVTYLKTGRAIFDISIHKRSILYFFVNSFLSILSVLSIHFWLGFRIRNLIVGFGAGLALFFISVVLSRNSSLTPFLPYAYSYLLVKSSHTSFISIYSIYSVVYFIIFSLLSFYDFARRYTA